jgi:hypothetical protein
MSNSFEETLDVRSRTELVRYLSSLAEKARAGTIPVENPDTADFIEASGAWLEGLDAFLRHHTGEGEPDFPSWSIIAMIFSAGLVYE